MKGKIWIALGVVGLAVALTSWAVTTTRTFRTTASARAVFQGVNPLDTNTPVYSFASFAGHDLVNLALGTALSTLRTNEVLALEIECDSSAASLVVFDKTADTTLATIATSTRIDTVVQQDNPSSAFPNRERFVAQMDINNNAFLTGGFLTIAGRIFLDPTTGCPEALLVDIDRGQDKNFGDSKVKESDEKTKFVSGFGHLIGVADVIFQNGSTNAVLIPFGRLNMRRQLAP